ncbi:hypothetical protein AAHE18_10G205600 [Arachis hypogaea]|nr:Putative SWI/SNF-related matrix-associated actin-dependent regulator of chromatin subfamily A member 3-like [Arachis hypogaea]
MMMHRNSKRRWAVTATPIKDGYVDAFAFMSFLDFEPFSNRESWNRFIQRPINQGLNIGHERLEVFWVFVSCISGFSLYDCFTNLFHRVLMKAILLRKTKDNELLGMLPKTIETLC